MYLYKKPENKRNHNTAINLFSYKVSCVNSKFKSYYSYSLSMFYIKQQ